MTGQTPWDVSVTFTASNISPGDLVRVTKNCDAGGLWGLVGVVINIKWMKSLRYYDNDSQVEVARVLLPTRIALIRIDALEAVK